MASDLELAGRIVLAALLGGIIGLERELTDKSAGLRTHISVALGAALFGLVSAYSFSDLTLSGPNLRADITRVASNVVVGIGFLGGGAILKHGATIRGLTTAGSLWVTAAIGLAAGLGSYFIASVTTAALLLSLWGLRAPRRWLRRHLMETTQEVVIRPRSVRDLPEIMTALHQLQQVEVRWVQVVKVEDATEVHAEVKSKGEVPVDARLAELAQRPDVVEVDTVH
jgi:putative Mg2+ transporter-C (MgtC) family protein